MIFRRHYTLRGFPSILVSRRVPTYYRPPASENSHNVKTLYTKPLLEDAVDEVDD